MNKTTIKRNIKHIKITYNTENYAVRLLPAVLGAALSTLAFIPTFAAETQANTNVAVVTTTEQAPTVPSAQGSTHQMVRHMANPYWHGTTTPKW